MRRPLTKSGAPGREPLDSLVTRRSIHPGSRSWLWPADHLVRIFHREVLLAEHVQRRKPASSDQQARLRQARLGQARLRQARLGQGSRRPRQPTDGVVVGTCGGDLALHSPIRWWYV